jgi:hypothetical protein
MSGIILKRFDEPDEVRTFNKGKFEIVRIGSLTIGRATYQPGWRWSVDVGPGVGTSRCNVEHVCLTLSGCSAAAIEGGAFTSSLPAHSSTFRPDLRAMTVGWWVTSPMSLSTFSDPKITRKNEP